ncbi:DNA glycosylase [Sulfurifustis variabilis]|uniref:Adenine DNA glycosylase n=1 Tax=Sulfurifustis variabilis TaxID=1675686 RepID=A0A1C7AFR9_9GAMM|nr:A/G-specific adenine glycosylase [Sulfurifustis variabilis]BAU50233.1 DNA glycosylase [Sulfurifustis variabilis]
MPKSSSASPRADRVFARALLAWYARHGRKDLPWKRTGDPYHVWVSEIMLQQTQVATVVPYFERFIARFPTVTALARADLNAVLHLWSGLGYYARARNLHHAARLVARDHGARLPRNLERLHALPGIGRSTAGAILALAHGERHPILDGNVKRVLARYHAIAEPLAGKATEQRLWELADAHTPKTRVAEYTQAIMDLGATLCRRRQPECARCPVRADCAAHRLGTPERFPAARARRPAPVKTVRMLLIRDPRGRVLLVRRPPAGVWGGLWGLPECSARDVRAWCRRHLGLAIEPERAWPKFRHTFSHFHLDITPIPARLVGSSEVSMEGTETVWYNVRRPDARGFAAPVQRLLAKLRASREDT